MLRRTWFAIILLCGSRVLLSSPRWSSRAAATATADDANTIHDRQRHRSQKRRRRWPRREDGQSTHDESSSSSSSSGSESMRRSMIECGKPFSGSTDYKAGDIVSRKGKVYQCRPHPYSLWCSNGSYAPGGATGYWSEAWIVSTLYISCVLSLCSTEFSTHAHGTRQLLYFGEKCQETQTTTYTIPAKTENSEYSEKKDQQVAQGVYFSQTDSPDKGVSSGNTAIKDRPSANNSGRVQQLPKCAPAFKLQEYRAGELVSKNNKNFKCKNYPYTQWCGLEAYAPGSGPMSAWIVSLVLCLCQ